MSIQSPSDAQKRAQAKFDKHEVKKREGDAAMSAYQAESRAIDARPAKLRAARLAKEAADREAAANAPPPEPKAPRARKKKVAAV